MDDNNMSRHTRLVEREDLPSRAKRCIGIAWCYGMAGDHANAAEQLLRALEVLCEVWNGKEKKRAPAEGRGCPHNLRGHETDAGRTGTAGAGSAAAAPDGERPAAGVDSGEAA
jgi:hypothetical protein